MMRDPFKIDGPTCLSFSMGRTSAYMLWRVLEANDGLPDDALVCLANTGKEEEASLRFAARIQKEWMVPINWLEYRDNDAGFALVDFASASRNGEPFEAIIRKRSYLPNPVIRFCTSELKIRPMHKFVRSLGWDEWDQFIGIRADEMRRVSKIRARGRSTESKDETMCIPLADAGVTVQEVNAFWCSQPFDLELQTVSGRTLEGNCDLCFLKPTAQLLSLIKAKPERAVWWARMENLTVASKPSGARFCKNKPSYADMARFAAEQRDMFDRDEEALECYCGD